MTSGPTQILLVAGASGVGKTAVSFEVSALMRARRTAHAVVDGDMLDASHPTPDDVDRDWVTTTNLRLLWETYRDLGQRRLVYVNTVSVLEADALRHAVDPAAEVTGVLLQAGRGDLVGRLTGREQGSTLAEHLDRSARRADQLDAEAGDWVVRVPTGGRSVTAVAQEVVDLLRWPAGPAADTLDGPATWV